MVHGRIYQERAGSSLAYLWVTQRLQPIYHALIILPIQKLIQNNLSYTKYPVNSLVSISLHGMMVLALT